MNYQHNTFAALLIRIPFPTRGKK